MSKRVPLRLFGLVNRFSALILFTALIFFNSIFTPNFFSFRVLWNIITQGTVTLIVSLGMAFAISSGGIDLSVGSIMPIAAILAAKYMGSLGIVPAIVLGLAVALIVGFFNGIMIGIFKIQPFIATLAMFLAGRGIAQAINKSMVFNFVNERFTNLGRFRIGGHVPIQIVYLPLLILLVFIIIRSTKMERYVQAIGDNRTASRLCGISVIKTSLFVYGASAILAGTAGVIEIARIGAADPNTLGKMIELDAIASVVLGGTPMMGGKINLPGTVFAALVMQLIVMTLNMNNIQAEFAYVVKSLLLVVTVVMQQREALRR